MIISCTGHRPNKLFGYNLKSIYYKILRLNFEYIIQENKGIHMISGMGIGADMIFALAVLKLKKDYPKVNYILECAVPCLDQDRMWRDDDRRLYWSILALSDIVTYVSKEVYGPWLMQKRNEYMVNKCDKLISVYDGSIKGGTFNCIQYANKQNKSIILIKPSDITNTYII